MEKELNIEPVACEACGSTDEGCTDNFHTDLGWCCQECRDEIECEEDEQEDDE